MLFDTLKSFKISAFENFSIRYSQRWVWHFQHLLYIGWVQARPVSHCILPQTCPKFALGFFLLYKNWRPSSFFLTLTVSVSIKRDLSINCSSIFIKMFFSFFFLISTTRLALEFCWPVLSCWWAGWAVSPGNWRGPYILHSPRSCPAPAPDSKSPKTLCLIRFLSTILRA